MVKEDNSNPAVKLSKTPTFSVSNMTLWTSISDSVTQLSHPTTNSHTKGGKRIPQRVMASLQPRLLTLRFNHQIDKGEATVEVSFLISDVETQSLQYYQLRVNFTGIAGNGTSLPDKTFIVAQGKLWNW